MVMVVVMEWDLMGVVIIQRGHAGMTTMAGKIYAWEQEDWVGG